MFDPARPDNGLPLPPPRAQIETVPVLKAITTASRHLAELKGRTHHIPNPRILLNAISLQEARASSEVENIFTTNDELYRGLSLDDAGLSPEQKEVLHYNEALWEGAEEIRRRPFLSTDLFIRMVNTIKANTAGIRHLPGTHLKNPSTGEVVYTPPEGSDIIHRLLQNLETFANDEGDGLDALVKMAVVHYQFEAIHPFPDGNGRTGRIVSILYLLQRGLLDQPILFLSRYIVEHKTDYYRHLRGVTAQGAWEPWILYLLRAVETTAAATSLKIEAIARLLEAMTETARQKLSSRKFKKELIELLFDQPYCRIEMLQRAGLGRIGNRVTAAEYLNTLAKVGLVEKRKIGRDVVFINRQLLDLLSKSNSE
jgi:Fic family protein